jgi:NitT/TauT family transport system substrate-binding protein
MLKSTLVLLLILMLAGCERSARPPGPPLQVRLAYTTQHDCGLVHLAQASGLFRQEGLSVQPLIRSFGKEALEMVLAGQADLATVAETPFMLAVLNGKKIAVAASIFSSDGNNAIAANRERGIAKISDLKGKRVGVTLGTTSEVFLDAFLSANGLVRGELTIVDLKPGEMTEALAAGRVDAVSAWKPTLTMIGRRLDEKVVAFFDKDIYTETFVLVAGQDYLGRNPEVVRRVLRALIKAEQMATEHPEQARTLIAPELQMDSHLLQQCWSASRYRVSLDQGLLIALEEETRWAIKARLVPGAQMPNYLDYISFDGLSAVRPEAVGIKR